MRDSAAATFAFSQKPDLLFLLQEENRAPPLPRSAGEQIRFPPLPQSAGEQIRAPPLPRSAGEQIRAPPFLLASPKEVSILWSEISPTAAAVTMASSIVSLTSPSASESTAMEGPVLNLMSKLLHSLRKKYNRILQMEASLMQGKALNKQQEEVFRSKPDVMQGKALNKHQGKTLNNYVNDEATELLEEKDLDMISALGRLVTSRLLYSGISHMSALQGCLEYAKQWLQGAHQPIVSGSVVTYASLRGL